MCSTAAPISRRSRPLCERLRVTIPPSALQVSKLWLVEHVGLARDALHIYVALIVFFASALLFRWPVRSWKPLAAVVAAALIGEAWDLRDSHVYGMPVDLAGNWKDIWNTCFWPAAIVGLARCSAVFERK